MFSLLPGIGRARCRWLYIMLWLSGVVVDRIFTPGGVDMRARLFVDRRHVNVFIRV